MIFLHYCREGGVFLLTYKEWLLKFTDVNLPIGDIANDVLADKNFPNTKEYKVIIEYLEESSYPDNFIRVFEYSFKMFYESTQSYT